MFFTGFTKIVTIDIKLKYTLNGFIVDFLIGATRPNFIWIYITIKKSIVLIFTPPLHKHTQILV